MRDERHQVWVDRFQTRLSLRLGLYLAFFLVGHVNLLFIWRLLQEGPGNPLEQYGRTLADYGPTFVCLALLMPVLVWDAVRFSHRLVGPLVRFRKGMRTLAAGEPTRPIGLRDGDFLTDLRDDFNAMLEALQRRGVATAPSADPAGELPPREAA